MNDLVEYFSTRQSLITAYMIVVAAYFLTLVLAGIFNAMAKKMRKKRNNIVNKAIEEVERESFLFKISEDETGYHAELYAGEKKVAVSPAYTSIAGVKSALKGLKNNAVTDNFTVYVLPDGKFTVRLYSSVKLFYESEEFDTREQAEAEIELIKKAAAIAEA